MSGLDGIARMNLAGMDTPELSKLFAVVSAAFEVLPDRRQDEAMDILMAIEDELRERGAL